MKKFAVIILAITLLFAFSIPALAQKAAPVAPGDFPGQGQGLEKWGQGLPPGQGGVPPGQGGFKTFPVPEPMTAVLLLAGLLGVAGVSRRIKKD